ncbi:MAG: LysM peptidoglycan-binding domain-containing protein [Zoogloeaceae bacterium]|nr:LysM peptidoglycan-binding domain-containing protein [Zoogloeaceae bacterium]
MLPARDITPVEARPLDLIAPAPDLWARIRKGFAMPDLQNDLVARYQRQYMSHPEYLRRMAQRSRLYLYHVVEALEARGMPMELAFLPMVESAYNPLALSAAQASGLWQFIPSTGKIFDLEQSWWQDQRRDVVASTSAALDYLQYVYDLQGDWHLALASYNWGEGAVGRAVAKNAARGMSADFDDLTLPPETRHYVPKLQALKNIFSDSALMAELEVPSLPNRPYFRTLSMSAPIDVSLAARFAGMKPDEFFALNPAYNRPVISPRSTLAIPADRVEQFQERLKQYGEPLSRWQLYAAREGDTLENLSARFGIAAADLRRANGLGEDARLAPGFLLIAPAVAKEAKTEGSLLDEAAFSRLARRDARLPLASVRVHVTRKGDTLSSISRRYRVSVAALKRMNHLRGSRLSLGRRLYVNPSWRPPVRFEEHPALVALPEGADWSSDARTGVSLSALALSDDPETLESEEEDSESDAGESVKENPARDAPSAMADPAAPFHAVSVSVALGSAASFARRQVHKIRKGDTLFSIARRYQVHVDALKRANPASGATTLKIGASLVIPGNG